MTALTAAAWARTHLGESVLRMSRVEHVMDTDRGIVAKRGMFNVAVEVGDDGWRMFLWAVMPLSRVLLDEWELPAIYVREAFLTLCDNLSEVS